MALGISAIEPAQGSATGYLVFLHGILGSGINWRSFARAWMQRASQADQHLGVLLVDLALHGELRDQGPLVPNTVAATAQDVVQRLSQGGWPIAGICGHSFGGKVAILAAQSLDSAQLAAPGPCQLWIFDSPPGARPEGEGSASTLRILQVLGRAPQSFDQRADFLSWAKDQGIEAPVAAWLATNLREREEGGYRFALDILSIQALLTDFFDVDVWPQLRVLGQSTLWQASVVVAGASQLFVPTERARLQEAASSGELAALEIPGAGHWLHVDAPEALLALMIPPSQP